jgi:alkanesulfonate monooxygenase SsuD/methylene tetrahydromethanopterin reductase-like flavin-dependent oxidoreductase (luciferase family)
MRFAVDFPTSGEFSNPRLLAELAREAENAGWDGCFVWDHVQLGSAELIADPWITLTAIALATSRIRIGTLVTPLFRRNPWKLARETVTLDHLSEGRLILGVGSGSDVFGEISAFGGPLDDRIRAEMLDEGLAVLTGLWTGEQFSFDGKHYRVNQARFRPAAFQSPRIPIWVAGTWPKKPPFRRAARYDGIVPVAGDFSHSISPVQLVELLGYIKALRTTESLFDVVHLENRASSEADRGRSEADREIVAAYAAAGATWWVETIGPSQFPLEELRRRIRNGPPKP